ncbi:Methane oxygenase PmoA [Micromonospora coriariae]|uniref:Methane oxygenase PmoA n=1 Tax=Micromonospora coriariae TaxID=285665 RepID=A0A1C4XN98_9ACTN|nr:PmoA family protein [Micromonospora coriariae]SCF09893.1 Methane oxygenase PmoA [Micromonospora coriariae]
MSGGQDPARLVVDGTEVARYVVDPVLDARHGPRPYLHPVRTLGGTVVTDALPADHVWHLGASLAVQDVDGSNLWGGRTYVRDVGYTWRDDHGRIAHTGWSERAADRLAHRLEWRDPQGAVLLTERRRLTAVPLTGDGPSGAVSAWRLELDYTLRAPAGRDVRLGSPATNGRPDGAGYGGFFWRAISAGPASVFSASATGETAVNGSAEPWVALRGIGPDGRAYTLVFAGLGDGDRWFTRTAMYPGVGVAFAFERPVTIAAGTERRGRHRVVIADGALNHVTTATLAAAALAASAR